MDPESVGAIDYNDLGKRVRIALAVELEGIAAALRAPDYRHRSGVLVSELKQVHDSLVTVGLFERKAYDAQSLKQWKVKQVALSS